MSLPAVRQGLLFAAGRLGQGDVADRRDSSQQPLISSEYQSYCPPPSPSKADTRRVYLDPDLDVQCITDAYDEWVSPNASLSKCRLWRNRLVAWSIVIWFLLVLIHVLDVDRSWKALEDEWIAQQNVVYASTRLPDFKANTTRIWGHSHNDEMQGRDAFTLALSLGFGSIEADTWLIDHGGAKSLMVGHIPVDLRNNRTLNTVYLDPMLKILEERNSGRQPNETWIGLLEDDPSAEIQIVIDFKSDGATMWPYVLQALEPLLQAGYVTTYDTKTDTWTRGPIMIIGTGNTPLSHVYYSNPRTVFFDGPLRRLKKAARIPHSPFGPATKIQLDATICPMASAQLPAWAHIGTAFRPSSNVVIGWMRRKTHEASRRGIKSRWWGAANNPAWLRRRMWILMRKAETDWINADDLVDLARWLRQVKSV